jgi:hypothetical protein
MRKSLLLLNEGAGSGRDEKFETRRQLLKDQGWEQHIVTFPATTSPSLVKAFVTAVRTVRREDVDVVHSVSNPFHLHLLALVLSFVTRRPWLAEFRDPLVTNPDVNPNSSRVDARKLIEALVVRTADRVAWLDMIQLTENCFSRTYPGIPEEQYVELPSIGYEEELFEGTEVQAYDEFTIRTLAPSTRVGLNRIPSWMA